MLNIIQQLIIRSSKNHIEKIVIPDLLALNPELEPEIMKSYEDLKVMLSEEFLATKIDSHILVGPVRTKNKESIDFTR